MSTKKRDRGSRGRQVGARSIFNRTNYIIFGGAFLFLIIGYLLMMQGPADNPLSRTVAPVILVISYCILIPLAILYRKHKENA